MVARENALSVQGAERFLEVSKQLKRDGQTELRKDLNKAMRQAAKPLIPKVRQSLRDGLPQRGGLNRVISSRPIRVRVSTNAATAGVSIVAAKTDPRLDQGRQQHPVFNRRNAEGKRIIVVQRVRPGLFSEPIAAEAPAIRNDLINAVETVFERAAALGNG